MSLEVVSPIPSLDEARELKAGYRGHPIDADNPLYSESLVALSDYGVEGVNYYSQPNNATVDPVEGVTPNVFVRKSVAEKLTTVNEFLVAHDGLANLFGARIELYVRDGFRSPVLQAYLHDRVVPELIRSQQPEWTERQVQARVGQVIAYPQYSELSMPPHFTGGAVDLSLREIDSKELIDTAHGKAELGKQAIHTDYLEGVLQSGVVTDDLYRAVKARRALYNVMLSDEIGGVSMENNPTETWHYSLYDQMWGILRGAPAAFYGIPSEIPEELHINSIDR